MLSNRGNGLQNKTNVEIMNFRFLSEFLYKNLENYRKIALKEYAINLEEKEKDILEPTVYCCQKINKRLSVTSVNSGKKLDSEVLR